MWNPERAQLTMVLTVTHTACATQPHHRQFSVQCKRTNFVNHIKIPRSHFQCLFLEQTPSNPQYAPFPLAVEWCMPPLFIHTLNKASNREAYRSDDEINRRDQNHRNLSVNPAVMNNHPLDYNTLASTHSLIYA